jgi:hypothetical protein
VSPATPPRPANALAVLGSVLLVLVALLAASFLGVPSFVLILSVPVAATIAAGVRYIHLNREERS